MLFGDERIGTPFLIPEGKNLMYLCIIKMQIMSLMYHVLMHLCTHVQIMSIMYH